MDSLRPSLEPTEEGVHTSLGRLLSPQLVETVVLLEHEAALQMERPEDRLLGTSGGLHGLFKPGREDAEEFHSCSRPCNDSWRSCSRCEGGRRIPPRLHGRLPAWL
mmetsp:Transcript_120534/g.191077  ORF Transcript_120534/g.191077 Transcript_120534/m.191077 type:complete len:106 (+) Transcript_120534:785-1102(+)